MGDEIGADAGEVGAGFVDVPLDDADGQVPLPHLLLLVPVTWARSISLNSSR